MLSEVKAALEKPLPLAKAGEAAFLFYHELALISGNSLLPLIYRSFQIPVSQLWLRFISKYGQEPICQNARGIYSALKARNAAEAAVAVERAILDVISGGKEIYDE